MKPHTRTDMPPHISELTVAETTRCICVSVCIYVVMQTPLVYMCKCVYICREANLAHTTYQYTYVYYTYMYYRYINTYMHVYIHACIHTCIRACMHACMHAYKYACTCMYIYILLQNHVHIVKKNVHKTLVQLRDARA